jgi:hypothetical protein
VRSTAGEKGTWINMYAFKLRSRNEVMKQELRFQSG